MLPIEKESETKGIRKGNVMKDYNDFEIWSDLKGFEGLYEISDTGKVRRVRIDKKGNTVYKYLKPRNGTIDVCSGGKVTRFNINRLVLEHYGIPKEHGEVWEDTEHENIKVSNLGRMYNTKTGHIITAVHGVKSVNQLVIQAFGLSNEANWKDIEGYEGLYQISDIGEVRNVKTGRVLKTYKNTTGYLQICLYKDETKKIFLVHRLVAQAFVFNPRPNVWKLVNHRNEDPTDNRAENLEWCNAQYNSNYGTRNERMGKSMSAVHARKRQEKLAKCKTEEEREAVLKKFRLADNARKWYLTHRAKQ